MNPDHGIFHGEFMAMRWNGQDGSANICSNTERSEYNDIRAHREDARMTKFILLVPRGRLEIPKFSHHGELQAHRVHEKCIMSDVRTIAAVSDYY